MVVGRVVQRGEVVLEAERGGVEDVDLRGRGLAGRVPGRVAAEDDDLAVAEGAGVAGAGGWGGGRGGDAEPGEGGDGQDVDVGVLDLFFLFGRLVWRG